MSDSPSSQGDSQTYQAVGLAAHAMTAKGLSRHMTSVSKHSMFSSGASTASVWLSSGVSGPAAAAHPLPRLGRRVRAGKLLRVAEERLGGVAAELVEVFVQRLALEGGNVEGDRHGGVRVLPSRSWRRRWSFESSTSSLGGGSPPCGKTWSYTWTLTCCTPISLYRARDGTARVARRPRSRGPAASAASATAEAQRKQPRHSRGGA